MMEYPDTMDHIEIPIIDTEESLFEVIPKLSRCVSVPTIMFFFVNYVLFEVSVESF